MGPYRRVERSARFIFSIGSILLLLISCNDFRSTISVKPNAADQSGQGADNEPSLSSPDIDPKVSPQPTPIADSSKYIITARAGDAVTMGTLSGQKYRIRVKMQNGLIKK